MNHSNPFSSLRSPQVKTDSLSARYEVVSQRHQERFSALEQAQVLVARFWETQEELEPWLGETETLIAQLPPPAIDTEALRLQQEQMRVRRGSNCCILTNVPVKRCIMLNEFLNTSTFFFSYSFRPLSLSYSNCTTLSIPLSIFLFTYFPLFLPPSFVQLLRESIAEHKPHIDKLLKIGPQLAVLSHQEGATVRQRYSDAEKRYTAIKEEVKGRAATLDEAMSQSAQVWFRKSEFEIGL